MRNFSRLGWYAAAGLPKLTAANVRNAQLHETDE
jgi:hypothetical protein